MRGLRIQRIGLILMSGGALVLGGCSSSPQVAHDESQESQPYAAPAPSAEAFQSSHTNGPPAHARAYGYRTKQRFNYYPSAHAYHNCETGAWFWFESGEWQNGEKLPRNVVVRANEAISVALDARTPFEDPNSPAARTHITHVESSKHSIQDY